MLFWFDSLAFVFQTHTDLFQEIILLYLILTRDSNVQLMCKFEANQCGFHDAIDLFDNVVAILKSMQNQNCKIAANENMQVVSDWLLPYFAYLPIWPPHCRKGLWLKIDHSKLCHFDSNRFCSSNSTQIFCKKSFTGFQQKIQVVYKFK